MLFESSRDDGHSDRRTLLAGHDQHCDALPHGQPQRRHRRRIEDQVDDVHHRGRHDDEHDVDEALVHQVVSRPAVDEWQRAGFSIQFGLSMRDCLEVF